MKLLCFIISLMVCGIAFPRGAEIKVQGADQAREAEKAWGLKKKAQKEKESPLKEGLELIRREYRPLLLIYFGEEEGDPGDDSSDDPGKRDFARDHYSR